MIKKFNQYIKESEEYSSEISILKEANSILKSYKNSPKWNEMIILFNNEDVGYENWTDLEMLAFYLKYKDDINDANDRM